MHLLSSSTTMPSASFVMAPDGQASAQTGTSQYEFESLTANRRAAGGFARRVSPFVDYHSYRNQVWIQSRP